MKGCNQQKILYSENFVWTLDFRASKIILFKTNFAINKNNLLSYKSLIRILIFFSSRILLWLTRPNHLIFILRCYWQNIYWWNFKKTCYWGRSNIYFKHLYENIIQFGCNALLLIGWKSKFSSYRYCCLCHNKINVKTHLSAQCLV